MRDGPLVTLLSLLPRRTASTWLGRAALSRPSRWGVRAFARLYGVDVTEAEHALDAYPTLDAFFVRRLRAGARPVDATPGGVVSPVDGTLAWAGTTAGGRLEVAPGRPLALDALLGAPVEGERDVLVLYLSPRDYHRVHAPVDGRVVGWRYVRGTRWPVFPAAVRAVDGLFGRNERLVSTWDVDGASWHVVLVGALGVGRIEAVFTDVTSLVRDAAGVVAHDLGRGDEVGVFHLGSTVVVVAPADSLEVEVEVGAAVRMGARVARVRGP